ncbi:MAG: ABC transporter permease [Candidatus Methanomethylophilaceae archaeon]|nr:ABC transporter permease [Candidatus Methanomethylophilaceae archaeon]MDD3379514.1 ABC transporter permease [Candidatus Methanomethylophilaceae archaeon]MDY0224767.1 ABC transporter permease [Candidatus Methanomethylophilaceae archaeon]
MSFYIEASDFKQVYVVTKNEIIKSVRGKKFIVSLAVILLIFMLITVLPYATGGGWSGKTSGDMLSSYLSNISMVSLLIVALLSSVALVSEFEERTALILFTRPIKRTSIFLGKIISCVLIEGFILAVYYILTTVMLVAFTGGVSVELLTSFGFCILYLFAASGIAFVISAFIKKGSVGTIITLLVLIMVIPIVTQMMSGDTWFMLNTAGNTIITCVPDYVNSYNKEILTWMSSMQSAIDYLLTSADPKILDVAKFMQRMVDTQMFGFMKIIEIPNLAREAGVLILWGVAAYFVAWIKFIRKEF